MSQSRRWCFTLNNYTDNEFNAIKEVECKYLIVGEEIGESGTPHLQGYVVFQSPCRLARVKRLVGQRAHLAVAKGTSEQNKNYCTKEGKFFEQGQCPITDGGKREQADWDEIKKKAKAGELDTIESDVFIKYYPSLRSIAKDYMAKPTDLDSASGVWIHGVSGIGKSRMARWTYNNAYFKPANKWWDGYQDEDFVILDDLDTNHAVLGHHLKIWSDRYSFVAEIKGGARHIRPKKFIVTSQYSIEEIWLDKETRDALNRRFNTIHLTTPWVEPVNPEPTTPCPTPNVPFLICQYQKDHESRFHKQSRYQ